MSPRKHKLHQHQEEQSEQRLGTGHQQTHREFETPEELLRYDAARTEVPPEVGERLKETVSGEPPGQSRGPERSWWQRLFGFRS